MGRSTTAPLGCDDPFDWAAKEDAWEAYALAGEGLRETKIARLKAAIAAGTYRVSAVHLAESLVQSMLVLP